MPVDELKTRSKLEATPSMPPPASRRPPSIACCRSHRAGAAWLARRAATELAIDPDLRFIRFQDTVFPDPGAGQPCRPWASRRPSPS